MDWQLEDEYRVELLAFLKVLMRDEVVGFSYEEKGDGWVLFIHLSRGVIQISGNKKQKLRDTVYVSPIVETVT